MPNVPGGGLRILLHLHRLRGGPAGRVKRIVYGSSSAPHAREVLGFVPQDGAGAP